MSAENISKPSRARSAAHDSSRLDLSELIAEFRVHAAVDIEKFDAAERHLGDVERRFDKVDERLSGMDSSLRKLADKIAWAGWSVVLGAAALLVKAFLPVLH